MEGLLECRFLGSIFRESITGGSGATAENLYFSKCPHDFYVVYFPGCTWEPVETTVEHWEDSRLLNNRHLKIREYC